MDYYSTTPTPLMVSVTNFQPQVRIYKLFKQILLFFLFKAYIKEIYHSTIKMEKRDENKNFLSAFAFHVGFTCLWAGRRLYGTQKQNIRHNGDAGQ
jgi:hypothetical protein